MPRRTTVSKGYRTVVPKEVRRASGAREGDILEWSVEGERIVIHVRRRRRIDEITRIISHGGDAVVSKHRVQRGRDSDRPKA